MRLFVALELPPGHRAELRRRVEALRSRLPRARWVPEENLHLTLAFLGETADEALPALRCELEPAFAGIDRLRLCPTAAGSFPPRRSPRVLWAGLEGGAELERLQGRVARAVAAALGVEPERRPFHPHVTLGRCKGRWRPAAAEVWRGELVVADLGAFDVERGVLMESRLSPTGARYRVVEAYPLGAVA